MHDPLDDAQIIDFVKASVRTLLHRHSLAPGTSDSRFATAVEDTSQEVLVELAARCRSKLRNIAQLDKVRAFIYGVARTIVNRLIQNDARQPARAVPLSDFEERRDRAPYDINLRDDYLTHLPDCLQQLDKTTLSFVSERFLERRASSYEAMARDRSRRWRDTGITADEVKHRVIRALAQLRDCLEGRTQ